MGAAQQAQAREALQSALDVLVRRGAAVERHLRGGDGRLEADSADRVAYVEMDEVLEQLDDQGRAEVADIRAALRRLDEGTWGTCTVCGGAIEPKRLAALPAASTCVGCAD